MNLRPPCCFPHLSPVAATKVSRIPPLFLQLLLPSLVVGQSSMAHMAKGAYGQEEGRNQGPHANMVHWGMPHMVQQGGKKNGPRNTSYCAACIVCGRGNFCTSRVGQPNTTTCRHVRKRLQKLAMWARTCLKSSIKGSDKDRKRASASKQMTQSKTWWTRHRKLSPYGFLGHKLSCVG